ncbi:ThuA domain-containing protein [Umezawaea sp. NPDC059074]|uniref:ThuA domain-containing protein n=1 Tax=Umezawaea sp. NPDC059074 TaxID=3346716 RepID=UPI0036AA0E38
MVRRLFVLVLAALLALGGGAASALAQPVALHVEFSALVFSKTAGFRHDSIPAGIAAIQALGRDHHFDVVATEDAGAFTDENLAKFQVVVFLSTTGDVLDATQQAAFERYVRGGGGYAGVHAASDTEYDWAWYGSLVGAYFKQHPAQQQATVKVEDPAHPSTAGLPSRWSRFDELYDFRTNPRGTSHVLASLDEKTYSGGTMGSDHPISWCRDYDGGRSWYTGLGHTIESYSDPQFLSHLLGGLRTAAGVEAADCSADLDSGFEKVTLDDNTSNPMMLEVAADGRVYYVDRLGDIKVIRPNGGGLAAVGHLDVFTANESGLLGLVLDPGFATNRWMYLYYSPPGVTVDRLSRFTLRADDTLDPASEKVVLDVPVQREECCHHGGGMAFDHATGDLWLANGDNSNPFASDGYSPIDERAGRSTWDAQRTSANTNDLRGKVLRIHPEADGTYTVPAGNLFAPGTAKTRPEIYAMGFRNPFRIGVDPKTHKLLVADYGPDAGTASPTRGPENTVEWNILNGSGNYGWPYCVGNNKPYVDYDFATGTSGAAFDCAAPKNTSPNNTGLTDLPPVVPATAYYHYNADPAFPELTGGAPMAGPTYRYDAASTSDRKWPAYWDGKAVFGEWTQDDLYSMQLSSDGGELVDINRIFASFGFKKPMDFEFGPDGALYLIEWGSGFGGDNTDSGIYRIDYVRGHREPTAKASADKTNGSAPLQVKFSSEGSRDPDGGELAYAWDFEGDGTVDSTEANPGHTYPAVGNFTATLTVTGSGGKSASASVPITVGNTAPTVTLTLPPNGGLFEFGDQIRYSVTVSDPEDGTIDCAQVGLQAILGHDSHGHPLDQYTGCEGTVQTTLSSGHSDGDNIFYVLEASYTDHGGVNGARPLTGRSQVVLQTKRKEAEYFTATGRVEGGTGTGGAGVVPETASDPAGGGQDIGNIEDGDYWTFDPVSLTGVDGLRFRAASGSGGGRIEVRAGSATGTLLGTAVVPGTGGWQTYQDFPVPLTSPPTASGPLFFVVRKPSGSNDNGGLLNVNWVDFLGRGVTLNQRPDVTATATPTTGTAPLTVAFHAAATDPEGDTPLTYSWDFGVSGAPKPTTADAEYTYQQPGDYHAAVTVTDSKGAARVEHVHVIVDGAGPGCLSGRSDAFGDAQLDRARWTVVRENQDLRVAGGALHIPTALGEIYGSDNSTPVPNLVVQPMPSGPWQATTKVSLVARDAYQQAGLVLYGDDDNYAKMVLSAAGANDAANRRFQFIREEAGVPNEVGDSNVGPLGAAYPDTAYVRFTSDGTKLTAAYSRDGAAWTAMPQTDKLIAGIPNPRIGLMSLASTGNRPVVDAAFDWFQLEQGAPGVDEFDGGALDTCRWDTVVRPDPTATRVTGGNLEIDTSRGDIFGGDNSAPKNFFLQTPPAGDWTLETKVDASAFSEAYQQGGLIAYTDDGNYVKLDHVTNNQPGQAVNRRIELRSEVGDVVQNPQPEIGTTQGVSWLRLSKQGSTFRGYASTDGQTWTSVGTVDNTAVGSAKVGLYAFGVGQTASKTAKFDYFHPTWGRAVDVTAPVTTATTDPATPGASGWFTGPVSVVLTATDDQALARTEYAVDGGAWSPYTVPVAVAEGAHTLGYRSVDQAGNVEAARTLDVRVDTTAPSTRATFADPGDGGWHQGAVPVTLTATDAGSGVASVEYALDGGAWTAYTTPVDVTGDGTHTLLYRAKDRAGAVEPDKAATVKIDGTKPTVLVSGIADGRIYGDSQDLRISWQAVDSTSGVRSVLGTLDGEVFRSGASLPLHELALGLHRLTVAATDQAGNRTTQEVAFGVTTSSRDIANLITRFQVTGWLSQVDANALQAQLTKVRKAEANGNDVKTIAELRKFRALADGQIAEVRGVLARDTDALIAALSGPLPAMRQE